MLRLFSPHSVAFIKNSSSVRLFSSRVHALRAESMLTDAERLMAQGKVRVAESIYLKIIKTHPHCREAYQQLWNSWVAHRSLKVPEKVMDDFISRYKKYHSSLSEDRDGMPLRRPGGW